MKIEACLSHKTDIWRTPTKFYNKLMKRNYNDPCPINPKEDGLKKSWGGNVYVNPPYSKLKQWVIKSIQEAKKGNKILMLIPSRTDTKAFELLYEYGCTFIFIKGRLHFNDCKNAAPFPSMLVLLTGKRNKIALISRREIEDD